MEIGWGIATVWMGLALIPMGYLYDQCVGCLRHRLLDCAPGPVVAALSSSSYGLGRLSGRLHNLLDLRIRGGDALAARGIGFQPYLRGRKCAGRLRSSGTRCGAGARSRPAHLEPIAPNGTIHTSAADRGIGTRADHGSDACPRFRSILGVGSRSRRDGRANQRTGRR